MFPSPIESNLVKAMENRPSLGRERELFSRDLSPSTLYGSEVDSTGSSRHRVPASTRAAATSPSRNGAASSSGQEQIALLAEMETGVLVSEGCVALASPEDDEGGGAEDDDPDIGGWLAASFPQQDPLSLEGPVLPLGALEVPLPSVSYRIPSGTLQSVPDPLSDPPSSSLPRGWAQLRGTSPDSPFRGPLWEPAPPGLALSKPCDFRPLSETGGIDPTIQLP